MFAFFTPLEQFDQVTWLSHRVVETLAPYRLFILEEEFGAGELYVNAYSSSPSTISYYFVGAEAELIAILLGVGLVRHFFPIVSKQISFVTEGFAYLFFLAAINVATGFFALA